MRKLGWLVVAVVCGVVLQPVVGRGQGGQLSVPLRLTAFAVNMSNTGTGNNAVVEIRITRWSTEAERQRLVTTFVEKGPTKLLDALQDTNPVGFIKLPTTLGYDLRFARQTSVDDGGTRIVIVTDRPIPEWEARTQARTLDYPFTLIDIRLKKDGTGEGKLSVATKLTLNKKDNLVELENWESEPVRLTTIKIDK